MLRIFLQEAKPKKSDNNDDNFEENEDDKMTRILEEKKKFKFLQNAFEAAGVCTYGLTFIKAKSPVIYVLEAIRLLINCLEFGNNHVFLLFFFVLKF